MALKDEIQKWLSEHPDATVEEAIWAGAYIEIDLCAIKQNDNDNNRNNTTRSLRRLCGGFVRLYDRVSSRKLCEIQRTQ